MDISLHMIRFVLLFIYAVTSFNYMRAQEMCDSGENARILDELVKEKNYKKGIEYVRFLQQTDTLSPQTSLNCIQCYENLDMYEECIRFCDGRIQKNPQNYLLLFDEAKGFCYYMLEDYEKAANLLFSYIEDMEGQGFYVPNYYYGILAISLHECHLYAKAEEKFERYFETAASESKLTRQSLCKSEQKDTYGDMLYKYAYNLFFQGKEKEGYDYLKLAKACGNKNAIEDCLRLESCPTFAKDFKYKRRVINDFQSILEKMDVYGGLSRNNPSAFWEYVLNENKSYNEYSQALKKRKAPGTLSRVLGQVNKDKDLIEKKLALLDPLDVGEIEKCLNQALCGGQSFLKELRIYPAEIANAFATPFGEIYLTTGLVLRYHFKKEMLLGVCAHEATHYELKHSLLSLWKQAKKEKKNKIWTGIAVGLNTVAQGAAAMYAASNGVSYDDSYWESVSKTNDNIIQNFREDTYYFQFKYGRSQELESDIVAYRFLEQSGIGGYAYIMALQLLSEGDAYVKADKSSDHPTINFRVGLLKYLYNKEHGSTK